jgi:hypothetical protein
MSVHRKISRMGWEEEVPKCIGSRERLFKLYESELGKKIGQECLTRAAEDEIHIRLEDGETSQIYLTNLWVMCRNHPDEALTYFSKFLSLADGMGKPRVPIDKNRIVPQARSVEWVDFTKGNGIQRHIAGDLWKVYAEDKGDTLAFLLNEDLDALGLTLEQLDALATDNLYAMLPNVYISHGEHIAEITTECGITSGALFLLTLWEDIAQDAPSLFAVLPSTASILFCEGIQNLQVMRDCAKELYEGSDHAVSQTILEWKDGFWKPLTT